MTNENISGFLNSIAEAKRAFDAEPEYQRQIAELERDKQRLGETVASRELRIHQLKQDQETLTQRLRSAEVERDDAGFRALEEADKVSALLTLVRGFVGDGLKAISVVEGQEQIVVSRAMIDAKEAEVNEWHTKAVDFEHEMNGLKANFALAQEQLTRPLAGATSSSPGDDTAPSYEPDGPFASTQSTTSETVSTGNATESADVSTSASPPERNRDESTRFKGRKYYDVTYFVPLHEWLSKGGTREDYDWRPLPEANRASNFS